MSQPSKPDGTDSRIVIPSDDEPEVIIANRHSTGRTYHTTECAVVEQMNKGEYVALSVAEWKGYSHCKRCNEQEGGEGYDHPGRGEIGRPTLPQLLQYTVPEECVHARALLLNGATLSGAADVLNVAASTVSRHALGKCNCNHKGHVLEHDGKRYVTADRGLKTRLTGQTQIDDQTCEMIRRAIVREGVNGTLLATLFGISDDAVQYHARGRCDHDSTVTPARYNDDTKAWEPVEADE